MIRTRRKLIFGGLCLAAAMILPGCAAERTSRPAFGWVRNLLPFRSARIAELDDAGSADVDADTPVLTLSPPNHWTRSDPSDNYFAPKEYVPKEQEFAQPGHNDPPPLAPPATEPGFFVDDSDVATPSTSSRSHRDGRPARLRDVFDTWRRRQPNAPRPMIPLDEPVAKLQRNSKLQVVDFQQLQPVVLGEPVFETVD